MSTSALVASIAAAVQIVLAGTLALLAVRAARRAGGPRWSFIAGAMLAFLAQGAVLAWSLLTTSLDLETAVAAGVTLNALALTSLYAGVLRP